MNLHCSKPCATRASLSLCQLPLFVFIFVVFTDRICADVWDMSTLYDIFKDLDSASQAKLQNCRPPTAGASAYSGVGSCWDFSTTNNGTYINDACSGKMTSLVKGQSVEKNYAVSFWLGIYCTAPGGRLMVLDLSNQGLRGTLSPSIYKLGRVYGPYDNEVNIANNRFFGAIPAPSQSQQVGLRNLILDSNQFTSTIPGSIFSMNPNIARFSARNNSLVGPIPVSLSSATSFLSLDLSMNSLTGQLLPVLPVKLKSLAISNNLFQGTLPASLGGLMFLTKLDFSNNKFTGTISGNAIPSALKLLTLKNNKFYGSLPTALAMATSLQLLHVENNSFSNGVSSNVLPSSIAFLYLGMNKFTSLEFNHLVHAVVISAPYNFIAQRLNINATAMGCSLALLDLRFNSISGSLASNIFSLSRLQALRLGGNSITGSLSSSIGGLSRLQVIHLGGNLLTGNLPASLGTIPSLRDIDLSNNYFSSNLPTGFGSGWPLVEVFNVTGNGLQGKLPLGLFLNMTNLRSLGLSENAFTGSTPGIYLPRLQTLHLDLNQLTYISAPVVLTPSLRVVDLSFNRLQGSIDGTWFSNSPSLEVFAASKNCLLNVLPAAALCNATRLTTLVLNDLSSRSYCAGFYPGMYGGALTSSSAVSGSNTIPSCLISLPSIQAIHLTGNGLGGKLADVIVSPTLRELSLGHNRLTGTLPSQLQKSVSQLQTLDLAYNRIKGTLLFMSVYRQDAYINLAVNRLSGSIPASLLVVSSAIPPMISSGEAQPLLSVLEGNMFSCNSFNRDAELPSRDPFISKAQCGSYSLDAYAYAFLCFCVGTPALLYAFHRAKGKGSLFLTILLPTRPEKTAHESTKLPQEQSIVVESFLSMLLRLRLFCIGLVVLVVVILLPTYMASSFKYSIQTNSYCYTLTAAFKSGVAPAGVFFVMWTMFIGACQFIICALLGSDLRDPDSAASGKRTSWSPSLRTASSADPESKVVKYWSRGLTLRLLAISLCNLLITVGSNIAYLYFAVNGSVKTQNTAKVLFAGFKFLYNSYLLPWLFKARVMSEVIGADPHFHGKDLFESLIFIVNTFLVPCLITALQDSSCFASFNPIVPPLPPVKAWYSESSYYIYANSLTVDLRIMNSAPACTEGAGKAFYLNFAQKKTLVKRFLTFPPPFFYTYHCTSTLLTYYAPIFMLMALLGLLEFAVQNGIMWLLLRMKNRIPKVAHFLMLRIPKFVWPYAQRREYRKGSKHQVEILDLEGFWLRCILDLLGTLSFGVICPILALAQCACIYSRTVRKHKVLVDILEANQRLRDATTIRNGEGEGDDDPDVNAARDDPDDVDVELATILDECKVTATDTSTPVHRVRLVLAVFSSAFLALFLVDIAGDEVGSRRGAWAPVLQVLIPTLIVVICGRVFPAHWSGVCIRTVQLILFGPPELPVPSRPSLTGLTSLQSLFPPQSNPLLSSPEGRPHRLSQSRPRLSVNKGEVEGDEAIGKL